MDAPTSPAAQPANSELSVQQLTIISVSQLLAPMLQRCRGRLRLFRRSLSLHVSAIQGLTKAQKNQLLSNLSSEPLDEWKNSNFNIKSMSSESGTPPALRLALQSFHDIKDVGKRPGRPQSFGAGHSLTVANPLTN